MSNDNQPQDYSLTTFNYVVVQKAQLLSKLQENRKNHQSIYDAACKGYWVKAKEVLTEKKEEFAKAIDKVEDSFAKSFRERSMAVKAKDLEGVGALSATLYFSSSWPLSFPTNHLEDYDRVINMLQFSVADKVKLSSPDFDSYVRNNWGWNKEFATSNQGYIQCITGSFNLPSAVMSLAASGYAGLTNYSSPLKFSTISG
jgi:hypothetical protein